MKGNGHRQSVTVELGQDAPSPDDLERWVVVGRGAASTFAKPGKGTRKLGELRGSLTGGGRTVTLADDVSRVFKDEAAVNNALRKLIEAVPAMARKRKTA